MKCDESTDWADEELEAIRQLMKTQELSFIGVLRQGLRLYQMQVKGSIRIVDAEVFDKLALPKKAKS